MRAQHGSAMFVGILVVAEMVEFAFPTRTEVWFCILTAAEMAEHAFLVRIRNVC